jgi:hypothetical protein
MKLSRPFVRSLLASVVLILSTVSLSNGQDLSKYRSFQLGMNVDSVLAKIGMRRPDVRTIYKKPALIEDLEWNPNQFSTQQTLSKSLGRIRFSFYNSELYKMVVTYDYAKTNGLTTQDVIDAISAEYGTPTSPESSSVTVSAAGTSFADIQKVLAFWEDTDSSYSLFRGLGEPFGLLIVSKERNTTAGIAAMEAAARDRSEEVQKQTDRQAREKEDREAALEKARLLNKKVFRP